MKLEVGTGKVDITAHRGSPTRRWHVPDDRARITDIRWPLHARTVAHSDGEAVHSFCIASPETGDALPEQIKELL
jgi:hypothetical protein